MIIRLRSIQSSQDFARLTEAQLNDVGQMQDLIAVPEWVRMMISLTGEVLDFQGMSNQPQARLGVLIDSLKAFSTSTNAGIAEAASRVLAHEREKEVMPFWRLFKITDAKGDYSPNLSVLMLVVENTALTGQLIREIDSILRLKNKSLTQEARAALHGWVQGMLMHSQVVPDILRRRVRTLADKYLIKN